MEKFWESALIFSGFSDVYNFLLRNLENIWFSDISDLKEKFSAFFFFFLRIFQVFRDSYFWRCMLSGCRAGDEQYHKFWDLSPEIFLFLPLIPELVYSDWSQMIFKVLSGDWHKEIGNKFLFFDGKIAQLLEIICCFEKEKEKRYFMTWTRRAAVKVENLTTFKYW